jgi:sulfur carrier protein ThiS
MRVVVAAYGDVRRYLLGGAPERAVDLAEGATVLDLAEALGAGPDEALLARRGADVLRESSVLADGDRVELFAPVGGG